MNNSEYLISAAGGNATAIRVIEKPESAAWYAREGKKLGGKFEQLGAEQAGFLITSQNHFEMAGGEFCGNATRAAGLLFSKLHGNSPRFEYTVSGFDGVVESSVKSKSEGVYVVKSVFPNMEIVVKTTKIDGKKVSIVDLGGIVHVVIPGKMPDDYEKVHRDFVSRLELGDRSAVGITWSTFSMTEAKIEPVVWVKAINTFFRETSCGSGSIAVAKVAGVSKVYQPTGKMIRVEVGKQFVSLESDMEVISVFNKRGVYFDRILPYRHCGSVRAQVADLYIEAFNDPNEVYQESNTLQQVIDDVWYPHINHGRIHVAIDGDDVVGMSCIEPIKEASNEEFEYSNSVLEYLESVNIRGSNLPIWYFSELAVRKTYRNRDDHIGTSLIEFTLNDMRSCDEFGQFGHDDKILVLTRTDAKRSLSINAFKRAGFKFLDEIVQFADKSMQIIEHGGKSVEKIWGYTIVRPTGY